MVVVVTSRSILVILCILFRDFTAATAEPSDRSDTISAGLPHIAINASGESRRSILRRLFANNAVQIDCLDQVVADEPLNGLFVGTLSDIIRQLLDRTNYIISYDNLNAGRVSRI